MTAKMAEAVETSTYMEGAASVRTVVVAAPWKPQQVTSPPRAVAAPTRLLVDDDLEDVPLPPEDHAQERGGQDETQTPSPFPEEEEEARRRMALFQAQRLLLAARPFDSIEYFYVHRELKHYLRPGKQQEEEEECGAGVGWWRWIAGLLCGGDAAKGRAAPILV